MLTRKGQGKKIRGRISCGWGMQKPSASDHDPYCRLGEAGEDVVWLWPPCQPRMIPLSSSSLLGPSSLVQLLMSPTTLKQGQQQDSGELRGPGARWRPVRSCRPWFSPSWLSRSLSGGHPPCPRGEEVGAGEAPGVCGPSGRDR